MERLNSVLEKNFEWSLDPKSLRNIYKQTNFDSIFVKLIAKDVIKILSPQQVAKPHNLVYDEDLVYEHLIGPLEKFICDLDESASQEDVRQTLEHLQALNQPSKICRRILKTGDVTFSCNDCGLDSTCVVCIDCFHKSAHKDHNYRMSNSEGGCCDCGDIEAWKQNYACTDHLATNQVNLKLSDFEDKQLRSKQIKDDKKSIQDKIGRLPKSMASKYFLVCQACLHYARMMLTWENYQSLPPCLEIDGNIDDPKLDQLLSKDHSSKNFFTVLFNDEVHTYDHVINTLVKIIKCTKMTASVMASTVSREGKSLIVNDKFKVCKQVKDMIANVRDAHTGPLKVAIIHGSILAHQAFALKLLEWIRTMSSVCDAFRILTAYTLLGTYEPISGYEDAADMTLVEKIMLSNTSYWKTARVEWNDLFVTTLLTEYSIKEQLARLLTRIYPRLMQDFIQDDHDHSVSILSLTTQLYTVPSLICMLIEEENALALISQTLIDTCKSRKRENPAISFENRNTFDMHGLKRGFYTIHDLRNLVNFQPTKWTDQLRKNVIEAVKIFLDLLTSMQGMDSVRRQLGQHLEYEPDWESGMTLQSRLITFISRLVTYCSFDEEVLVAALKETQARLLKNGGYKIVTKELFSHQVSCIQYDVSTSPVSVHLPLTRFAAALIVELMKLRPPKDDEVVPYDESLVILHEQGDNRSKLSMIDIMEPSLRTEVMIAQYRIGMWRRNGYSLVNQLLYFHGAIMRREMFDRDILVLQECAAMCEANAFMIHLLNKFSLFPWVSSETTREPLTGPKAVSFHNDEEIMAQLMSLGEEFLQLLLTIVGERYRVGVGVIEEDDVIKNEIIQILCISPSTRSDLTQKLCVNDNELDCIKAVANLKRSTEASTGKYELKDEYYARFNPFFYHYIRQEQSNAFSAQLKRKKNLKESLICCPPPAPVELTKQFRNLNELLKCDITLIIIRKILTRALGPPENSQECPTKAHIRFVASDLHLDQILHLIGLGLYEQDRDPLGFGYLQAAHEKEIFQLLKQCYEKAKRSKDLIFWTMKKADEVIENLMTNYSASLDEHSIFILTSIREFFRPALATCDTSKQDSKKRNSELAAQRRERIMAMMKANQDKFLSSPTTKQLVADTEKNDPASVKSTNSPQSVNSASPATFSQSPNMSSIYTTRSGRKTKPPKSISGFTSSIHDKSSKPSSQQKATATRQGSSGSTDATNQAADLTGMDFESDDQLDSESVTMEEETNFVNGPIESSHLCILCRDEQKIGFKEPTMVLLTYIQRSAVLSKNRNERRIPNYALTPTNQLKHQYSPHTRSKGPGSSPDVYSFTSDNSWSFDATYMPSDLFFGPNISTCGHVMHYDCWQSFFDAIQKRETSRPNRNTRHVSFELEKYEILCPLCECISNATIPLLPQYVNYSRRHSSRSPQTTDPTHPPTGSVFAVSAETLEKSSENLSAFLHALRGTVDLLKHIRHNKNISANISVNHDDKYIRLLQPTSINDVLEDLDEADALCLRDFINSIRSDKISSNQCTKSLLCSISTFAERIHTVGLDLDRSVTGVNHARIFMMTSWSISYTIQAFERVARFKGAPLFEDLESSKNLCLTSLLRFACCSMLTHHSDMMQSLLVRKLRYLLINDEHQTSSPCCLDIDALETFVSLFILLQKLYAHIDDFGHIQPGTKSASESLEQVLSTSFNSSQSSGSGSEGQNYPWTTKAFGHEYFRNLLHLMLMLNMLQVIISMHNELTETSASGEKDQSTPADSDTATTSSTSSPSASAAKPSSGQQKQKDYIALYNFYKEIILASGHPNCRMPKVNEQFAVRIKKGLLPFLRSCAILFFHLSQVPPPQILRTKSAFFEGKDFLNSAPDEAYAQKIDDSNFTGVENESTHKGEENLNLEATSQEFDAVCHYLDLPNNFSALLQSQEARHLARSWLRHSRVLILIEHGMSHSSSSSKVSKTELMPVKFIRQPHLVNRLIELPFDYSELVDRVSDFTCPSIKNEDSRTPTMCLVCGIMLCSQSYCCQRDLNDLASNYQQILQHQQESRNQANSSSSSSSGNAAERARQLFEFRNYIPSVGMMSSNQALVGLSIMAPAMALIDSAAASVNSNSSFSDSSGATSSGAANSVIHQQLVGSCTYHAYECSGGVGVFLRIRNSQILLLSGRSKGCYMPAPYIDDHGETDFGLVRGNPLHLNRQHYEKLQQMWLTHAIPEQISRTLEYSPYASSINWHLH